MKKQILLKINTLLTEYTSAYKQSDAIRLESVGPNYNHADGCPKTVLIRDLAPHLIVQYNDLLNKKVSIVRKINRMKTKGAQDMFWLGVANEGI